MQYLRKYCTFYKKNYIKCFVIIQSDLDNHMICKYAIHSIFQRKRLIDLLSKFIELSFSLKADRNRKDSIIEMKFKEVEMKT